MNRTIDGETVDGNPSAGGVEIGASVDSTNGRG
jgi:hypothetical protein